MEFPNNLETFELESEIEIHASYSSGYGGPESYTVLAVYQNRVLESVHCGTAFQQGVIYEQLRAKWELALKQGKLAKLDLETYQKYSPICDHCGRLIYKVNCSTKVVMAQNLLFCKDCEKHIPEYREKNEQANRDEEAARERKRVEELKEAHLRIAKTLEGAIPWKDGWFFKRHSNGYVRIMKHCKNHYPQYGDGAEIHESLNPNISIDPGSWESIVEHLGKGTGREPENSGEPKKTIDALKAQLEEYRVEVEELGRVVNNNLASTEPNDTITGVSTEALRRVLLALEESPYYTELRTFPYLPVQDNPIATLIREFKAQHGPL